jgi:hypothetical protein
MNKQLIAFFILFGVFASSDVYASRARVLVEGTGDSGLILGNNGNMGSFYADDAYNMFYNPAYVNDYKNFGIIEKSNFNSAYTSAGGNNVIATSGGTTAEGGFVTSIGNYSLGLYMNRTDVLSDAIYQNPFNMRPIDVMIGGDNGLKWGLGLTYSSYKAVPTGSTATSTDNDVVVRLGFEWNNLEPFGFFRIGGDNHFVSGNNVVQNKMWALGTRYHWGEWSPFAAFKKTSFGGTNTGEIFGAGFGRNTKLAEGVKMGYSLAFFRQANGNNFNFNVTDQTELNPQRSVVPIDFTVEGDAASWITLRAGLSYNLVDDIASGTTPDSTSGRIGATFHVDKVDFDWAIGKSAGFGGEATSDTNSQNFDIANGFFTAAAVSYKW